MEADVKNLVVRSGALQAVEGLESSPGRFTSLRLEFESGGLSLRCNADTDEIVVATGEFDADQATIEDGVLADLIGMTVEYAWLLTNHRGYVDAFQLRFTDGQGHDETRQFEVGAAAIDIRRVVAMPGRGSKSISESDDRHSPPRAVWAPAPTAALRGTAPEVPQLPAPFRAAGADPGQAST